MKNFFYIQHKTTGAIFDPEEQKFYGPQWDIVYCDDADYLQNLIDCDQDLFAGCIIQSDEFTEEESFAINKF